MTKLMEWYRSNKNGLHYFFYRLCRYSERNNIHIIKDNHSFRDFVELVYCYSSEKRSDSKFDIIKGLPRKFRSFSKALNRYKKVESPKKEEAITISETIQLMKEDDKPKIINNSGNKLTSLYMNTETLYKKAHEKMQEIEKNNKNMRIMPQWIFVQVEFEMT